MPHADPIKRREYQRKYQAKHYRNNRKYYIDRSRLRRQLMLEVFDQFKQTLKCRLCPEDDHWTFDMHHLDPSTKDRSIGDMIAFGWSWPRIIVEIQKCVCLCANCHRKVHKHEEWSRKLTTADLIIVPDCFRRIEKNNGKLPFSTGSGEEVISSVS